MINDYIKKLRRAADALEDLLASDPFDHPKIANAIGQRVARNLNGASVPLVAQAPAQIVARGGVPKGYKYPPGAHWKQRQAAAHAGAAEAVVTNSKAKGYKYPRGTHWTQRPENKAKVTRITKRASKARLTKTKGPA
jgi:hypothetical protein